MGGAQAPSGHGKEIHAYGYASDGTRTGTFACAVIHRRGEAKLQKCRYGCDAKEDAFHVVMNCKKTKGRREIIKKICLKKKLEFNMKTLFCDLHLQDEVEALIGTFLNV